MRTIGLAGNHASDAIPASHLDLVECPPVAALTTAITLSSALQPEGVPNKQ
jgi:hypothetical protein